jgi:hypothetical protein
LRINYYINGYIKVYGGGGEEERGRMNVVDLLQLIENRWAKQNTVNFQAFVLLELVGF